MPGPDAGLGKRRAESVSGRVVFPVALTPTVAFDADSRMVRSHATAEKSGNDDGTAPAFGGKYFKTLWFDDNLNGKIGGDGAADRAESVSGIASANALHDLHDQNAAEGNIEPIWESLTDDDGDPNAGDLGEVDMMHDADDTDTDDDETATDDNLVHPDGLGDNYPGGDNDGGTICDATWTITREVLFADGTFGCTATRPGRRGGVGRRPALPSGGVAGHGAAARIGCNAAVQASGGRLPAVAGRRAGWGS